jgi:hypothetical protein
MEVRGVCDLPQGSLRYVPIEIINIVRSALINVYLLLLEQYIIQSVERCTHSLGLRLERKSTRWFDYGSDNDNDRDGNSDVASDIDD